MAEVDRYSWKEAFDCCPLSLTPQIERRGGLSHPGITSKANFAAGPIGVTGKLAQAIYLAAMPPQPEALPGDISGSSSLAL